MSSAGDIFRKYADTCKVRKLGIGAGLPIAFWSRNHPVVTLITDSCDRDHRFTVENHGIVHFMRK